MGNIEGYLLCREAAKQAEEKTKPASSRASVRYRKTADGQFRITGFDGFLDEVEIQEKYGPEVYRIYLNGPWMAKVQGSPEVYFSNRRNPDTGHVYDHGEFQAIIAQMKKCGARLHQILQDVRAAEELPEKTIFI